MNFFDGVADLYDRARPGYPEAMVEDVLTFARVRAGDRVLEIGCGTGQATASFAARGLRMVCLEPGPNLAALARKRLAAFPGVEVRCETFERWPIETEAFALVLAGRSLHWVKPRVRYSKAARALKPGGALAIFHSDALPGDSPLDASIRRTIGERTGTTAEEAVRPSYFERPLRHSYEWTAEYDAARYEDLLRTMHRLRSAPAPLFAKLRSEVERHGGRIAVRYVTTLSMARRQGDLRWWRRLVRRLPSGGSGGRPTSPSP